MFCNTTAPKNGGIRRLLIAKFYWLISFEIQWRGVEMYKCREENGSLCDVLGQIAFVCSLVPSQCIIFRNCSVISMPQSKAQKSSHLYS